MSDQLSVGDWLSAAVASIIVGVGSAMAWFTGAKAKMENRIASCEVADTAQKVELAIIRTNQTHLTNRMDEVRDMTIDAHRKLDEVLREVKRP